jgi:hypothetical protein
MTSTPTFDILKNSILSRPRMMGTPGEAETSAFLLDFLTRQGLNPYTEEVEWSTAAVRGRKLMFGLAGLALIGLNFSLRLSAPANGIVTLLLALVSMLGFVLLGNGLSANRFKFLGKSASGKNVMCEIAPDGEKEAPTTLYLTAHSDSIASNMPGLSTKAMIAIVAGLLFGFFRATSSGLLNLLDYYGWQGPGLSPNLDLQLLVVSGITLILICVSLFTRQINTSPGACDNGSGSAILLSLAGHFWENPPENVRLKFIWFTAEEWGLYGSKGYVAAHKTEIAANRAQSYVINVDMVGSELGYMAKVGLIFKKPLNVKLNGLIAQAAREAGIAARPFNTFLGGNSDHAPFKKEKVEVCCFLAEKDLKIIHSPKDTIEKVQSEKLEDAVELIKRVVGNMDRPML